MPYASQRYSADTMNSNCAALGDAAFVGFSRTLNGQTPSRESQYRMPDPMLLLWENHAGPGKAYVNKKGWGPDHQCAINMSAALQLAGVDMSTFTGSVLVTEIKGITLRLATDIYELTEWVKSRISCDMRDVNGRENPNWNKELTGKDDSVLSTFWGRQGIIIAIDSWKNESGQLRGHVDLFNRSVMKRAGTDWSLLTRARKIYFFQIDNENRFLP